MNDHEYQEYLRHQEHLRYQEAVRRWEYEQNRRMKSRFLTFLLIGFIAGAFLYLWPHGGWSSFEPAWSNANDRPVVDTQQRASEPRATAYPTTKVVLNDLITVPTMTPVPPTPTITPQTSDTARSGSRPSGPSGPAPTETPSASIIPAGEPQRPSGGG